MGFAWAQLTRAVQRSTLALTRCSLALPGTQVLRPAEMSSREIFKEFEFLLEKSQRSFNRLRDLPPYGNSRWEHHFHKAFHIYSKLWKFQQENRCIKLVGA